MKIEGATSGFRQRLGLGHRGFRAKSRVAAGVALFLLLLVPMLLDLGAFQVRMREHLPDLKVWLPISELFVNGERETPMYPERGWYLYPPIFLILLFPLTFLSEPTAGAIFELLKWIAVFWSLLLTWRICSREEEDQPPIVALGTIAFSFRYIWNDMGQGNINCFILLAIVAGCRLVQRKHYFWGGAVIAFAACVKVTPAIFLVYFVYRGWWRTVPGALVCATLCWVVVPGFVFGWSHNFDLLRSWFDLVIESSVRDAAVDSLHTNQSLPGLLNRLFTDTIAILPETRITILELGPGILRILRITFAVLIFAAVGWVCRSQRRIAKHPLIYALDLGVISCVMLMLSGISWKAHFVVAAIPFAALLAYFADARMPAKCKRLITALTLVAGGISLLSGDMITPSFANLAEAWGVHLAALITLFAACATARCQLAKSVDPSKMT